MNYYYLLIPIFILLMNAIPKMYNTTIKFIQDGMTFLMLLVVHEKMSKAMETMTKHGPSGQRLSNHDDKPKMLPPEKEEPD